MKQQNTTEPQWSKLKDSWSSLQDDYELRNAKQFSDPENRSGVFRPDDDRTAILDNGPPPLYVPTRTRKLLFNIGLGVAVLDLCVMPIVYFYSLKYGAKLKLQTGKFILDYLL